METGEAGNLYLLGRGLRPEPDFATIQHHLMEEQFAKDQVLNS
jgi:hypothetical protein